MSKLEKKLSGITKIEVEQIEYTWTIYNYRSNSKKNGEYLSSPSFSHSENKNVKWCLNFYPKGLNEESKDSVSLYLKLESNLGTGDRYQVHSCIRVVNCKQEKKRNFEFDHLYEQIEVWGYSTFAKQSYIQDETNGFLSDNKLTIVCTMTVSMGVTSDHLFQKKVVQDYKFCENIGLLLDNEEFSDVTLVAKDKKFKVHKNILAAQSPVFMAMFKIDMIEKKENTMKLTDFDGEVTSKMLQYMYTGKVNHLDDHSSDLLKIADKYDIAGLKSICENTLYNELNVNNAVATLVLAVSCNCQELKNDIIQFIIDHKSVIIKSQEFETFKKAKENLHLAMEVLYEIVNSSLNIIEIKEEA